MSLMLHCILNLVSLKEHGRNYGHGLVMTQLRVYYSIQNVSNC